MPKQTARYQMPVRALRPRFWEVAARVRGGSPMPPFQSFRVNAALSIEEAAEKMDMNVDEYTEFEQGKVRPVDVDLLTFCDMVHCHPLDLYQNPSRIDPLPPEIVGALLELLDEDKRTPPEERYDPAYIARARARLDDELHRSWAILSEYCDIMRPLWVALGYSQDLSSFNAPFYKAPNKPQMKPNPEAGKAMVIWKESVLDTRSIIDSEIVDPRVYVENCLMSYQLAMEHNIAVHGKLASQADEKARRVEKVLNNLGGLLFGPGKTKGVIEEALSWARRMKGVNDDMMRKFVEDPSILYPLSPETTEAWLNGDSSARNEIKNKARFFLRSIDVRYRAEEKIPGNNPYVYTLYATRALKGFKAWRNQELTGRLLHWFENYALLQERLCADQDSRDIRAWRCAGQLVPILFPGGT